MTDSDSQSNEVTLPLNSDMEEKSDDPGLEDPEIIDANIAKTSLLDNPSFEELKDDSIQGFFEHTDSVYTVSMSPSGKQVLTGGGDDVAYIWDINDGEHALFKLEGHSDSVITCKYSSDGDLVATGGMDGTVRIYKAETGELQRVLEGPAEEIEWIAWHPRGPVLLAGSADTTCWMWAADTGGCLQVFAGHLGPVTCGGFTPDGKTVFTGSQDGSAFTWSPKTGESKHHFKGQMFHESQINAMACHPTTPVLLSGSSDKTARLSNYKSGKSLLKVDCHEDSVESVDFCKSTSSWFATGGLDGLVSVWDMNTSQCRIKHKLEDGVIKVQWHPSSPLLYCAGLDTSLQLVDGRTGTVERVWTGHQAGILDFSLSRDGNVIATAGDDKVSLVFKRDE
eukprot:842824_1